MVAKRVVHEQDETIGEEGPNQRIIASDVEIADSALSQAKGLMFRSEIPEDYALVLEVGGDSLLPFPPGPPRHLVHMLFVRMSLDVVWLAEDEVKKKARMHPWRSMGLGKADRILELPAGNADGVEKGDTVRVVDAEELGGETSAAEERGGESSDAEPETQ